MNLDPQYHLPPGRAPAIKAVPRWYKDTLFRSTLEADWAAMFDALGWYWEYEPEAVALPDGTRYRPDFRLPAQKVWCEVKGPHNERLEKAVALQDALHYDEFEWGNDLVVILRPPGGGEYAQWGALGARRTSSSSSVPSASTTASWTSPAPGVAGITYAHERSRTSSGWPKAEISSVPVRCVSPARLT